MLRSAWRSHYVKSDMNLSQHHKDVYYKEGAGGMTGFQNLHQDRCILVMTK